LEFGLVGTPHGGGGEKKGRVGGKEWGDVTRGVGGHGKIPGQH